MGALQHGIEAEGVATTAISLVREHTETIRPPRALWVPFELGRPLGPPCHPEFQKRIVVAALKLFEATAGPVLVDFTEPAPPGAADDFSGWSCPIALPNARPASDADIGAALAQEIALLKPWHEMARGRRGRTTVGLSGLTIEANGRFLASMLDGEIRPSPVPGLALGMAIKIAAEDLKAFYLEAATAGPGSPSSAELGRWFWDTTDAARLLFALRRKLMTSSDALVARVAKTALVPMIEAERSP